MEDSSSSSLVCRVDVGIDTTTNWVSFRLIWWTVMEGSWLLLMDCVLNPLIAEAMACKEALKWIKSRGVMDRSISRLRTIG
nr:uncharacterized protein LOC109158421 [Ipomoea batatas]